VKSFELVMEITIEVTIQAETDEAAREQLEGICVCELPKLLPESAVINVDSCDIN